MAEHAATLLPLDRIVAVVTGASSGIGSAIARRLQADGAVVVAGSRRLVEIDGVDWVPTDVTSATDAERLIAHAVEHHGRIDALVNNAGVQVEKAIVDTTDDEFDLVMNVNVRGVFNCTRAAVHSMRDTGGGAIVNIGSIAAGHADHGMAVYNASKGAVHALTRAVATDHGRHGIRCVAVAPGWIATEMAEAAFAQTPDPGGGQGRRHRPAPDRPTWAPGGCRRTGRLADQRRRVVRDRIGVHHRRRPRVTEPDRRFVTMSGRQPRMAGA